MNFIQRFNGFNLGRHLPRGLRSVCWVLLVWGLAAVPEMQAGSKPPTATLRFHLQASQGMPPEHTVAVTLIDPPQVVQVKKLPELSEKHLDSIEKTADGRILITFTSIGANLLDASTSSGMGAIMVVICNGRVVYAPVIDVPLRDGRIVLPGGITDQEIVVFQKMIAQRKRT